MIKTSVKKPFTVLVGVILVIVLGVVAFTRMTTDLLPNIEFPYMIVYTVDAGASPEKVETEVTDVMEAALGTTTGLKELQSVSNENVSVVFMEFEQGTDMNAVSIEMNNTLEATKSQLPENANNPIMMEISADMLPVMLASVDVDGMDRNELSEYVRNELLDSFERLDGVASVTSSGTTTDKVTVTINRNKIEKLNDKILRAVDRNLADGKEELDKNKEKLSEAQRQLDEAEKKLESSTDSTSKQLGEASAQVDSASAQLNALLSQETSLKANQQAYMAEKKALQQYAEMNTPVQAAAAMIAVYSLTGELPEIDLTTGLPEDAEELQKIAEHAAEEASDQVRALLSALSDPATFIGKNVTDEQFAEAIELLMNLPGSDQLEQLTQVSRKDFVTLATTTAYASTRITELDGQLNNIKTELAAAQAMKPQLEQALKQAEDAYAKLEAGEISAAVGIAKGSTTIQTSRASLESAQAQLENATKEFEEARDKAYESADIEGVVTADMIHNILTAQNFEMPAGYIENGDEEYVLKVGQQYESVKQLKKTMLFSMDLDGIGDIYLTDVCDVSYGAVEDSEDATALVNGNAAVMLSFSKQSTASTSDVSDKINEQIAKMQKQNPDLHITPLMDQGDYIRVVVSNVLQNLIFGGLLAVLVLLLFLRDIRPTVIIAFSIPLSVLFAVVLMYFTDITLNMISLSGLALGIGMLVDNSIVVIENIYRLRNQGVPAVKASVMGAREVAGAIFASTLTTVCVFLPIVFTEGLARQLFVDMGLTIAYSLFASLIVALTVVPTMGSTVLKRAQSREHRMFDAFTNVYSKVLRWTLGHRLITMAAVILLFGFACVQTVRMGLELMPDMSSAGQMSAELTIPEELNEEERDALIEKVSAKIQDVEGIETVGAISSTGLSLMASSGGDNSIRFYLMTDGRDGNELKKQILEATDGIAEMTVQTTTMDMSSMAGSGVAIQLIGHDLDELAEIAEDLAERLKGVEGLTEIEDGNEDPDIEELVIVNKDKAMRKGLTVAQVYASLAGQLESKKDSTTLTVGAKEIPVVIEKPGEVEVSDLMDQTIESTDVQTGEKKQVKLRDIAELSRNEAMTSINHDNGNRTITVSATVDENHNVALVSREVEKLLDHYDLPEGYTATTTGENESINETMGQLALMLLLAIVFIYLIMVAQFQSLLSPFIVMFTMPLAFTGGLLFLLITGNTFNILSMLGFIVLAGVIVNNGIVLVDCVNRLRLDGMSKKEALVEAGRMRLRPVLMTALTTILSMSTMALGLGSGAEIGQSMALVLIGGLVYGTVLTLIVVPIMYDIFNRRKKMKRINVGEEEKDEFRI